MSTTVQTVRNTLSTILGAKTGNYKASDERGAISRAVKYFNRKIGLPSNESKYTFDYFEDQEVYSLPSQFSEALFLRYHSSGFNTELNAWEYKPDDEISRKSGQTARDNRWSIISYNAAWQLLTHGSNITGSTILDTLDIATEWVASGDASGLTADTTIKKYGVSSLAFDITNSTGLATITRDGLALSVKDVFEKEGSYKLWSRLTDADLDSVSIRLTVSSGNYWTIAATAWDDGNALSVNDWQKFNWSTTDAVETGTVAITDTVTEISFIFDLAAGFVSAVDMRIDQLFSAVPDKLDLIYYNNYIGKTIAGVSITNFTADTDTILICDFLDDFEELIAYRAAYTLMPALRADKEFMQMYRGISQELLYDHSRQFPRKKVNNFGSTRLRRG